MATFKNLRYCEVKHESKYYDVMIGVDNLDEVNNVLQEWGLNKFGVALDLPTALINNMDIKEVLTSKNVDENVYITSAVSSYMDMPKFAGISGALTLPKVEVTGKYVIPAFKVFIYSESGFLGVFGEYNIDSTELTLTADSVNYIGVDYNEGTPIVNVYANDSFFDYSSIIPIGKVLKFDDKLNVIPLGMIGDGLTERQFSKDTGYNILGDFDLSNTDLYVELGAMDVVNATTLIETPAVDTDTADNDMWLYYRDNTGIDWQKSENPEINNTQYQGVGLQTLGVGKFVINYIYRVIDDTNKLLFNVLSGSFDTLELAKTSPNVSNLPDSIKNGSAILVGRFIVEQGSTTPVVQKIQTVSFA